MKGIMKRMAVWVAAAVLLTAVPAARAEDGLGDSAVDSGPASTGFSTMAASVQIEALSIKMENGSAVPAGDYKYEQDTLTISGSGSYTVSMAANSSTGHKIVVENACTLTLDRVRINAGGVSAPALLVKNNSGEVMIRLRGSNRLYGASGYAGLQKEGNGTLNITSADGGTQGELNATGRGGGAGIGGGSGGRITISGGTVTALGENGGAGIGGGRGGGGGTVNISGANTVVTAKSQIYGSNSIVPGCDVGSGAGSNDGGSLSVTDGAKLIMGKYGTNVQNPIYKNCTVIENGTIIHSPDPVPAPDNTGGSSGGGSGGSSGGGGSSRSSGSGSAGTPLLKGRSALAKVRMIDAAALERLAAQAQAAGRDYAVLSSAQPVEIQGNAWGALKDFPLAVQMTEAGAVRFQLVLPDPAKLTGPLTLDAAGAEDAAARFGK